MTPAQRTFAAEPFRVVKKEDTAIQSRRLLARQLGPILSLYDDSTDAQSDVDRRFDLWSGPRRLFRVATRHAALARDLGHVIEVKHPRLGLANGAPALVLAHAVTANGVEMRVLA